MPFFNRPHTPSRRGMWLITIAALLWGTIGPATQELYQLNQTTALSINFIRLAIAVPILAYFCWRQSGYRMIFIAPRDARMMMITGFFIALNQLTYLAAIAFIGSTSATLISICAAPVLVTLVAVLFLREHLTGTIILAMICALSGTMLLISFPANQWGANNKFIGTGLALLSAIGYAGIIICGRFFAGRYHPLQITTVSFGIGALLLLALALPAGLVIHYSLVGWLLLIYLGIVPTAVAYGLFYTGLHSVKATVASIIVLLEPLTSTILSFILFGNEIGIMGLIGGALLLGGLLLLSLRK